MEDERPLSFALMRIRCTPRYLTGLAVAILLLAAQTTDSHAASQGITYASPPIRGRVVEDMTERPLAEVSVLATWTGHRHELLIVNTLHIMETKSATDGTFLFPGWTSTSLRASVDKESPILLCFAPGYVPESIVGGESARRDSVEIRMRRFKGSAEDWGKALVQQLNWLALSFVPLHDQPVPEMLKAIDTEWQRLPENVKQNAPSLIPVFELMVQQYRAGYKQGVSPQ